MGKKRVSLLGSENEDSLRAEKAAKLEQKKLRQGKELKAKAPGLKGGQRVVDTATESLVEFEAIEAKNKQLESELNTSPEDIKTSGKRQVHHRSKAYHKAKKLVADKTFSLTEAIKFLPQISLAKFGGSVELHITLKSKISPLNVELPYSTGKIKKIGVVDESFLKDLESGKPNLDLDILLATPSDMAKLVKFAKILGPKGLMPNPKTGTVVENPAETAKKMSQAATITIKTEKDTPVIHTVVGKFSQSPKELQANTEAIFKSLSNTQSSIVKAVLKSTMSPAVKIQL